MVKHTEICETCGDEFAYDAPVNPAERPKYCGSACFRVGE